MGLEISDSTYKGGDAHVYLAFTGSCRPLLVQSKAIFKLFTFINDYVLLVVDEFALKAMVECEENDILINKVKPISSSSNSQNDKLIAAL